MSLQTSTLLTSLQDVLHNCQDDWHWSYYAGKTVKASTLKTYIQALKQFLAFANTTTLTSNDNDADVFLCRYMISTRHAGVGWSRGRTLLASFNVFFPLILQKGRFPRARRVLLGMMKMKPSVHHPPLPRGLAIFFAFEMLNIPAHGFRFFTATLLAFDCYLRCDDFLQLRKRDVVFGNDFDDDTTAFVSGCTITIQQPKSGRAETVVARDEAAMNCLFHIRSKLADDDDLIFPFSYASFYAAFTNVRAKYKIPTHFTPHSLRHGGTTWDFMRGVPLTDIQHRGRWASFTNAKIYMHCDASRIAAQQCSTLVKEKTASYIRKLKHYT